MLRHTEAPRVASLALPNTVTATVGGGSRLQHPLETRRHFMHCSTLSILCSPSECPPRTEDVEGMPSAPKTITRHTVIPSSLVKTALVWLLSWILAWKPRLAMLLGRFIWWVFPWLRGA